jgi:hypothetical protein
MWRVYAWFRFAVQFRSFLEILSGGHPQILGRLPVTHLLGDLKI